MAEKAADPPLTLHQGLKSPQWAPLIDETFTRDPDRARALNWAVWTPERQGASSTMTTQEILERARAFLAVLRETG